MALATIFLHRYKKNVFSKKRAVRSLQLRTMLSEPFLIRSEHCPSLQGN
jgi:hypothetical protein